MKSNDELHKVLENIKEVFGQEVFNSIYLSSRRRNVVYARMLVAKSLRMYDWTIENIASYLNKDHSTISYYLKKFEEEYSFNTEIRELANKILE